MSDFDIDSLNLDDSPLEGIDTAWESWVEPSEFPPPPYPGKKSAVVANIRDMKQVQGVLSVVLDLKLRGGDEEGKPLNFVRLSGKMYDRQSTHTRTSQLLDFVKSSGVQQAPTSNKMFAQLIQRMVDAQTPVYFQMDWRAYCTNCAETVLMDETGEQTAEAAAAALDNMWNSDRQAAAEIQKKVRKAGEKFRNYRAFPEIVGAAKTADGVVPRKDIVDCPACGQELRAQANITRWLKPPTGDYAQASGLAESAPAEGIPF